MTDSTRERTILAIDLKSFYASVECIDRGLDPFSTPLVVCDLTRGQGTIILAVSPYLKTLGIPSRLRLYDLPKVEGMIYATPRMERYIQKSVEVLSIYLNYVSEEDMHVYSVDEAFLDVTSYLKAAKTDKIGYAKRIIREIRKKTGLTVTAGIGPNLFVAKAAMDVEAKHTKDFLASWEIKDLPQKLWPLSPLSKMWGIGSRMEKRLNDLGFYTVGDIAVSSPDFLKNKFGVIGEEIYLHANGIDDALIQKPYVPASASLAVGQTLFKDYTGEEAELILNESLDELILRLHKENKLASGISLWIGYSASGGFAKGLAFNQPTNKRTELKEAIKLLFSKYYDRRFTIRNVSLAAYGLIEADYEQLSLFSPTVKKDDEAALDIVLKQVRELYGLKSLCRASALLSYSTVLRRDDQIGGHRK